MKGVDYEDRTYCSLYPRFRKSERTVTARKTETWRKSRKRQPDDAKWDFVLAEYRDPMAESARAVWPVKKRVYPIPPMEPGRRLGTRF